MIPEGSLEKDNSYIIFNLSLPCAEQILYKFGSVSNAHHSLMT